jgi:hypothetical protein
MVSDNVSSNQVSTTIEVTGRYINQENLQDNGELDIPSGAAPSPLFEAQPFTQQMLRFEEFGPVPLGDKTSTTAGDPFPSPVNAVNVPDEQALDNFLRQYITPDLALPFPFPTRTANDPDNGGTDENPWKAKIEKFLGRELLTPPAEGRPPGELWAHQRFEEFFPQVYFNTAQAGARTNTGFRDPLQRHQYKVGEFAAGGLYYNVYTYNDDVVLEETTKGLTVQFHPNFPVQDPYALWTWDGTFPPKLLQVRYGETLMMRHYNALPIDPSANSGFGLHTITTHEHNGHHPAESNGFNQAFFFPGQFYDYYWPMVIAGHDSINTSASDPRAGTPDGNGGIKNLRGDWREMMSTHWLHDQMIDFSAQNIYKGNAAMMNYYSSVDRGNESIDDGVNLRFPSGTDLDWGNRDYDINLLIADKAWDREGQLFFNIFNQDGWLGDQILTNWLWKPYLDVRARRYRLRILNGSVTRHFRFALVQKINGFGGELAGPPDSGISYNLVPFHMIANDGNIMEHAVLFDGKSTVGKFTNRKGILPTQATAERYDIIVDFSQFVPGTKLYMVNLLEHHNGKRPHQEISLQDILDETYTPLVNMGHNITDPTVSAFMEFRVQAYDGIDLSMNPSDFVAGQNKMIPLPKFTQAELDNAIHRTYELKQSTSTDTTPWLIKSDGETELDMDPRQIEASPTNTHVEIWHFKSNDSLTHLLHIPLEEGQILKRDGDDPPEWERWARKDVYRIGHMNDSMSSLDFAIRFRDFFGSYTAQYHNSLFSNDPMQLRLDIEKPDETQLRPTPMPAWDGVEYVRSYTQPTFRTGDINAAADAANEPAFGQLMDSDETHYDDDWVISKLVTTHTEMDLATVATVTNIPIIDTGGGGTFDITGTATPSETITISNDIGATVGTAIADATGDWRITQSLAADIYPKNGDTLTATTSNGGTSTFTFERAGPVTNIVGSGSIVVTDFGTTPGAVLPDPAPVVAGAGATGTVNLGEIVTNPAVIAPSVVAPAPVTPVITATNNTVTTAQEANISAVEVNTANIFSELAAVVNGSGGSITGFFKVFNDFISTVVSPPAATVPIVVTPAPVSPVITATNNTVTTVQEANSPAVDVNTSGVFSALTSIVDGTGGTITGFFNVFNDFLSTVVSPPAATVQTATVPTPAPVPVTPVITPTNNTATTVLEANSPAVDVNTSGVFSALTSIVDGTGGTITGFFNVFNDFLSTVVSPPAATVQTATVPTPVPVPVTPVITPTNNTATTVQAPPDPIGVTPAPVTPVITTTNNTTTITPIINTPVTATSAVTTSASTNIVPVDVPTESFGASLIQSNGLTKNSASSRSTANHQNRTASSRNTANSLNKITPFEISLDNYIGVAKMNNDNSIYNLLEYIEGEEELLLLEELTEEEKEASNLEGSAEAENELPDLEGSAEAENELPDLEGSADAENELPRLEEPPEVNKEERPCKKISNKFLRDNEEGDQIKVYGCVRKDREFVSTETSTK